MIIVVLYVAIKSKPPVGDAVSSIFHPGDVGALVLPLITLLGGSCGGYITFSGAHVFLMPDIPERKIFRMYASPF